MRYIVLAVGVIVALALESTIFPFLSVAGVKPDLVLIIVIFFALLNGGRSGAALGFFAGLLEDLLIGRFIGINALSKMLTGLVVGQMEGKVYRENVLVPLIFTYAGTVFCEIVFLLLGLLVQMNIPFWGGLARVGIPVALYNACLVPLSYGKFYHSSTRGWLKNKQAA
jgi:rod shape-determining protein MreD